MVVECEAGEESSLYDSNDRDQYFNISDSFLSGDDRRWDFYVPAWSNVRSKRNNRRRILPSVYKYVPALWV